MIFPAYHTPDDIMIRCYCINTDHVSIPYKVLLQHFENNVHPTAGIPSGMTRFGEYDGEYDADMDMSRFELLSDSANDSNNIVNAPIVSRYQSSDQTTPNLWRGLHLDFEATITTAVPHDGTLSTPLMRIPGYVVVGRQYG